MVVADKPSTSTHPVDFVHTGPGTLAGRYLRSFWQPVFRAEDLPAGRAVPIRVLGEDFTLYRGEGAGPHPARLLSQAPPASPAAAGEGSQRAPSPAAAEGSQRAPSPAAAGEGGKPHLLAFRCAHRGTQLSTGWVEGDDLRCFYHGWKYDPSGQCVEQPAEPEPFGQKIRIRAYPVQEYLGLIFAYLGELTELDPSGSGPQPVSPPDREPPPFPRYSAYEEGVLEVGPAAPAPVNYFNRLDNAPDHAHLVFVHRPFMNSFGVPTALESVETEYGIRTSARFPNGWVNETHFVMPNVSLFPGRPRLPGQSVWTDQMAWVVPVDDEHYRFVQVTATHGAVEGTGRFQASNGETPGGGMSAPELGEAIIAGRLRLEDLTGRRDIFEVQDCVSQRGQGVIADRANERLGRSDVGVVLLRKLWERELLRLAAGRPLKNWAAPEGLVATLGPGSGAAPAREDGVDVSPRASARRPS